jgi:hypothetical protein
MKQNKFIIHLVINLSFVLVMSCCKNAEEHLESAPFYPAKVITKHSNWFIDALKIGDHYQVTDVDTMQQEIHLGEKSQIFNRHKADTLHLNQAFGTIYQNLNIRVNDLSSKEKDNDMIVTRWVFPDEIQSRSFYDAYLFAHIPCKDVCVDELLLMGNALYFVESSGNYSETQVRIWVLMSAIRHYLLQDSFIEVNGKKADAHFNFVK